MPQPTKPAGAEAGRGGPPMMGHGPGRNMVMQKAKPKQAGATLRRLWAYLSRQQFGLIIVYITTILSAVISLIGPFLLGKAIDRFIMPKEHEGFWSLCLLMIGIYALGSVVSWIQVYVMTAVSQRTVLALRQDLFDKYQQLPLRFFDTHPTGELMSRTTNDIENVSNTLNQSVTQLLNSIITLAGSLVIMLRLNLPLTLVSLISIPLVLVATRQITRLTRKLFKAQQQHLGELNGFIEETVSGQKIVKLFRREPVAVEQFQKINHKLNQVGIRAQIASGMVGPVMNMVNNLSFALIAAAGGWMVLQGHTSVGIVVSFLNYSKQFGRPITELANQFNLMQSAIAGAERVFEIFDLDTEYAEDHKRAVAELGEVKGSVEFRNVTFSYKPGTPVLQDVSFTAEPGQMIALVGPTGAGKTTIINLLTRFYEIDQGDICIDGVSIRDMDKDSLRSKVGIVLQDTYVFSGSIRENIRFGRLDATDAEVEHAARLANADRFISRLPDGYDTVLAAEGSNLSHGQRQLLTIARAILADPAILILDEATSSVDTRTEMHVQEAMQTLMKGRTSFVIAHRLSTIQDADRILFIHGGRIAEQGDHRQLLEAKGFYYDLYTSQFQRAI
ncbi:ABC transporter ATP-binding protein [Paenibacillus cineris]|uniref:Multidrug ABC transporter ATP-binding protein n=2 Tax=Paenibacillus TaxID=44249 RepID=A0ABQ4LLU6_9BACL|nr:multidrug ABC transporter ATP-binding protein [Paenibacillus cineris]